MKRPTFENKNVQLMLASSLENNLGLGRWEIISDSDVFITASSFPAPLPLRRCWGTTIA